VLSNFRGGLEDVKGIRELRNKTSELPRIGKLNEASVSLGTVMANVTRSGKRLRCPSITGQHSESIASISVDSARLSSERVSSSTCMAQIVKQAANTHNKQTGNMRATRRCKKRDINLSI
jgi:hypothetical protein